MFFINNILKKNNINKTSINSQILNQSIINNQCLTNAAQTNSNMPFYETLRTKLERNKEKISTCDYIYNQVHFLNHIPLQLLCKSLLVMSDELFFEVIDFSWNLLLNSDQEISSSAAVLFLIGSIKQPNHVEELMRSNLSSKNVETRYRAVLKYYYFIKFNICLNFFLFVLDLKFCGSFVIMFGLDWKPMPTLGLKFHLHVLNLFCHHRQLAFLQISQ